MMFISLKDLDVAKEFDKEEKHRREEYLNSLKNHTSMKRCSSAPHLRKKFRKSKGKSTKRDNKKNKFYNDIHSDFTVWNKNKSVKLLPSRLQSRLSTWENLYYIEPKKNIYKPKEVLSKELLDIQQRAQHELRLTYKREQLDFIVDDMDSARNIFDSRKLKRCASAPSCNIIWRPSLETSDLTHQKIRKISVYPQRCNLKEYYDCKKRESRKKKMNEESESETEKTNENIDEHPESEAAKKLDASVRKYVEQFHQREIREKMSKKNFQKENKMKAAMKVMPGLSKWKKKAVKKAKIKQDKIHDLYAQWDKEQEKYEYDRRNKKKIIDYGRHYYIHPKRWGVKHSKGYYVKPNNTYGNGNVKLTKKKKHLKEALSTLFITKAYEKYIVDGNNGTVPKYITEAEIDRRKTFDDDLYKDDDP